MTVLVLTLTVARQKAYVLIKDCCKVVRARAACLQSDYRNCFTSFYIPTTLMPPKRKAATGKVAKSDSTANLASSSQSDPSPPKLRKRNVDKEKNENNAQGETEVKQKNEKKLPSKDNVAKDVQINKKSGSKKAPRKTKNPSGNTDAITEQEDEDNANGFSRVTRRKKAEPELPVEPPKSKAKKKDEEKPVKPGTTNKTVTDWVNIDFTCTKKDKAGQKPNLKISCWNVGGLKSWVNKDCLQFLEYENPDILCLQETKCSQVKLPEEIKQLKEYKQYWCSSEKEGYAGVGLLTREEPLQVKYGIEVPEMDADGRCITAEYNEFYLICVYVPNAGRKLVTLPKRSEWNDYFKDYVKSLDEKKPVIICGDMNVAHNEIDLARPANNTKNAGFTKEEREGLTQFLQDGYVDTFRQLYPDKTDAYTFWSYMANARAKNIGWRLDYFIISERILDKVCDTVIRSDVRGSDHCPITLFINI